jgi:DNA-binding NtrC family response regulator
MVGDGRFRADLLYRLDVVRIEVPPLRERREDIPLLAHHFLRKHARPATASGTPVTGLDDDAVEGLLGYDWPGNVRELENAIESAVALAAGPRLRRADLALPSPASRAGLDAAPARTLPLSLEAYERAALERALAESGGDSRAAARRLGIGRSTFYRKLAKHGLEPRGFRRGPDAALDPIG